MAQKDESARPEACLKGKTPGLPGGSAGAERWGVFSKDNTGHRSQLSSVILSWSTEDNLPVMQKELHLAVDHW